MKDNKRSDNSDAQLSPEELIRMLKNQLNIEPTVDTENENPEPEEEADTPDNRVVDNPSSDEDEDVSDDISAPGILSENPDAFSSDVSAAASTGTFSEDSAVSAGTSASADEGFAEEDEEPSPVVTDAGHDPREYASKDDEVDFFSFLAGSGISVDEMKAQEPSAPDLTGDEDIKLFRADDHSASKAPEDSHADAADPSAQPDISPDASEEYLSFDEVSLPSAEASTVAEENVTENPHSNNVITEEKPTAPEETDYSFDDNRLENIDAGSSEKTPDFNMLLALGVSADEVERIYGKEAAEDYRSQMGNDFLEKLPEDIYEYTSPSQNAEIKGYFNKEKTIAFVKVCAAAVLLLLALLFENLPMLGVQYSGWLDQAKYPVVHIMVDLQLVLIASALALDELIAGISAILRRSPNAYSLLDTVLAVNLIFDIVLCFMKNQRTDARLLGASFIFMAFLCLLMSFLRLINDSDAFHLASSNGLKCCVMTDSSDDSADRVAFSEELGENSTKVAKVLSFSHTRFVNGFFSRIGDDNITTVDRVLIPASLVFAVVAFVLSFIREKNVSNALYAFNCASAFLFPVSVFAIGAFSFFRAGRYATGMKAAILGEKAPFEVAGSSIVSFEDKDAFPSYCIKLRNLKVYGKTEVVDVLRISASVFRKIGGPLNDVLECATGEIEKNDSVKILRSGSTGVQADYDGHRVLIGKPEFLHEFGITPYSDVDDREYLKSGDVSIMYVAVDRELCAKFYIQYTLDVDFQTLLRELNRSGVCVSIRTSDPNIDLHLLQAKLNLRKTALQIVYRTPDENHGKPLDSVESGVIGSGTPIELVRTAMLCERLVHVLRTNNIVKALSLFVGVVLLLLFSLLSVNLNVYSVILIVYQLFWMIPTFIVSKLFL